jgi:hypothetical protein
VKDSSSATLFGVTNGGGDGCGPDSRRSEHLLEVGLWRCGTRSWARPEIPAPAGFWDGASTRPSSCLARSFSDRLTSFANALYPQSIAVDASNVYWSTLPVSTQR